MATSSRPRRKMAIRRVSGTLNSQYRAQSDVELLDSLSFRMAADIVDIQPNGNLVIEGHQTIDNNEEQMAHFTFGCCAPRSDPSG